MAAAKESALVASLKELARVVVMGIIPVILGGINVGSGEFNIDWRIVSAVAIVAGLRFVDKWLHKSKVVEKGLVRF